jgi:hypothetical protein
MGNHRHPRVRKGPRRSQVGVARIVGGRHRPRASRKRVEIVGIVPVGRDKRMIAVADDHQIAIGDRENAIRPSIGGVEALDAIPGGIGESVVIGLFEIGLNRRIVAIVFMRRIARPVSARCENLADEQPVRGRRGRQDVDDLSGRIAAAAYLECVGERQSAISVVCSARNSNLVFGGRYTACG